MSIDPTRLLEQIELYLNRDETNTLANLCHEARANYDHVRKIRTGQIALSIDYAERLCMALQIDLGVVVDEETLGGVADLEGWCRGCRDYVGVGRDRTCPWCEVVVPIGRKRGREFDKGLRCITPELLAVAYQVYGRGLSARRVAELIYPQTTYRSLSACAEALYSAWTKRGWKLRGQSEVTIQRNYRHGRSSRAKAALRKGDTGFEDYAAYRREQRKLNGDLADIRCASSNKKGEPCGRWALMGKQHCITHDPERQAELQAVRERAWAASRARMLRWGDLRPTIDQALAVHGRPALTRAARMDPSVMGRMLRYDDDHAVKPETWARLSAGIDQLNEKGVIAS